MRIAIVGAGIAGLGAAWALSGRGDVVIYESESQAGGHATTVPVRGATTIYPAEAGFLLFDDWQYPTFSALLRTLDVAVEPIAVSVSYSGRHGAWSTFNQDTELWNRVREEAIRFSREAPAIAMLPRDMSLARYLAEHKYSLEFRNACLLPLIGVLLVNRSALFEVPAWLVGAGFARLFSFFAPTAYFRVRDGARAYTAALLARLHAEIRLETSVLSVVRTGAGVFIRDAAGGAERFDRVVLAVDARTALGLLEDPSELENRVLGAACFETTRVCVHSDRRAVCPEGGSPAFFNYRDLSDSAAAASDGKGQVTIDQFGLPEGPFVTWDAPEGAIDPRKVIAKFFMEHVVYSTAWAKIVAEQFPAIQGVRNTWFCGAHASGFPTHEGALVSGLAAACALGANYPFPSDRRALAAFHQVRRHYLPSTASATIAPLKEATA